MDRSIKIAAVCAIAFVFVAIRPSAAQEAVEAVVLEVSPQAGGPNAPQDKAGEKKAEPAATSEPFILRLVDGDYASGRLVESLPGRGLVWKSPAFQETLRFPQERVSAIVSSSPEMVPSDVTPKYRLELNGGDVLFGDLVAFDHDKLVLAETDSRRIAVALGAVRKISRTEGGAGVECVGVDSLKHWKTSGAKDAWQEETGAIFSKSSDAIARRNAGFHLQSRVELQFSWKKKPRFVIALMAEPGDAGIAGAYRLEGWRNQIVLVHESDKGASIAVVQGDLPESGEMAIQILIDHEKGEAFVLAGDGRKLAELAAVKPGTGAKPAGASKAKINRIFADHTANQASPKETATPAGPADKTKTPGSDVVLADFSKEMRLETLRVSRWTGTVDVPIDAAGKFVVRTADGRRFAAQAVELKPEVGQFEITGSDGPSTLALADVQEIARLAEAEDGAGRTFVAQLRSGARLSGDLERVDDRHVWLKRPGLPEPYPCEIQSLVAIKRAAAPETTKAGPAKPRLELDGLVLHGQLTDSAAGGPLRWQAEGCEESVSLPHNLSGRIVLRDRAPPPKTQPAAAAPQAVGVAAQVTQVTRLFGLGRAPSSSRKPSENPALVHLREGDVIPCRVKHIGERGVEIESTLVTATSIPHDKIRVVELDTKAAAVGLPKEKKDRLLMLPRAQRNNAPTHLVRSTRGDYLRGRLLELDESNLSIELRLETQVIPVDRVARIIWLHRDEAAAAKANTPTPKPEAVEPPAATAPGERTQVVFPDGNRLSFQAESFADGTLNGTSSLLGAIHAKVAEVDRILFGTAIDKEASELPFSSWKLRPAPDPLEMASDSGSSAGPAPGSESPLVGKPAPDIQLDLLDGGKFELKKLRGKVVVLDFWATWCGPCLRSTPLVEKVVGEAGEDVQLIAVNLQETPQKIQKMLDRLELKLTTALDKDGLIAEKYGATSIPLIVVIDREGVVARVYEGVSSDFEQKLRTALQTVAGGKPEGDKAGETPAETTAKPAETSSAPDTKSAEASAVAQ